MTAGTDRWETILAGIRQKQSFARQMGGAERVERHRAAGKLDARQRAESLFDDGSFVEIGALTGIQSETGAAPAPADGLIAGFGLVDGRPVLAGIEDFTVLGGSIGDAGAAKRYRLTQLAAQERVPLIFMLEGAGHRLTNSHGVPTPNDLQGLAELSGLTPIVCVGETDEQRTGGQETEIVGWQLAGSLPKGFGKSFEGVIAYEPVWAIGTGRTPTEAEVAAMHAFIREELVRQFGEAGQGVRILYGGSVKPDNAAALLAVPHVGGALVGGASLKADDFLAIARAARGG